MQQLADHLVDHEGVVEEAIDEYEELATQLIAKMHQDTEQEHATQRVLVARAVIEAVRVFDDTLEKAKVKGKRKMRVGEFARDIVMENQQKLDRLEGI